MSRLRSLRPNLRPLSVLIASLLLMLLAGSVAYRFAQRLGLADLQATGMHRLELYSASLEREIGKYAFLPGTLTLQPEVLRLLTRPQAQTAAGVNAFLEQLNERAGTLAIYVIDRDGQVRASSNWRRPDSFVGEDLSFRPYFRDALGQRQRPFLRDRHHPRRTRLLPLVGAGRRRRNPRRRGDQGRAGKSGKILVDRGSAGPGWRRERGGHPLFGRRLEIHHAAPARRRDAQGLRPHPAIQPPRATAAGDQGPRRARPRRPAGTDRPRMAGNGHGLPGGRAFSHAIAAAARHAVDADGVFPSRTGRRPGAEPRRAGGDCRRLPVHARRHRQRTPPPPARPAGGARGRCRKRTTNSNARSRNAPPTYPPPTSSCRTRSPNASAPNGPCAPPRTNWCRPASWR